MVQVNFKILKKWFYPFEIYKWGFSQSKSSKDSFVVVATIYMEFLGLCSIRNSGKQLAISIMYHYCGT